MSNITPSEEKQPFKIGRIEYNLPSFVIRDGEKFSLAFKYLDYDSTKWTVCYFRWGEPSEGTIYESILSEQTDTFNQAVKAMHKKIKEINLNKVA